MIWRANDKYFATVRSTWIANPPSGNLQVTALPANLPTIVVVGWKAPYETVFSVEGVSGDHASNYALTGVTRIKGANENIPVDATVNCLNNEEFFNQFIPYVSMHFRGDYAAGTAYAEGDVVYYNGSSYVAKKETTGHLPTDTNYWILIAEIGASIASAEFSGDDIVFTLTDASTVTLTDAAITLKGDQGDPGSVSAASSLDLTHITTPTSPASNHQLLYAKSGDKIYNLNSAGSEKEMVTTSDTQTLTNKTLSSPVINTPTGIVKGDVGLGNVDNTSDANKPVSTSQQNALNLKVDKIIDVGSSCDLNTIITTGFYRLNSNITNGPGGVDWCQMIVSRGNDTILQIIIKYYNSQMCIRGGTTSTWGPWRTL